MHPACPSRTPMHLVIRRACLTAPPGVETAQVVWVASTEMFVERESEEHQSFSHALALQNAVSDLS